MRKVCRHDALTLYRGVKDEDFERFMKEELMPYFSERYRGPTRVSIADLKHQSLLKNTKAQRGWLWITVWDGSPEAVRGAAFEHTRMMKVEKTEAMMEKLASFGKRVPEKVFQTVEALDVATNA